MNTYTHDFLLNVVYALLFSGFFKGIDLLRGVPDAHYWNKWDIGTILGLLLLFATAAMLSQSPVAALINTIAVGLGMFVGVDAVIRIAEAKK